MELWLAAQCDIPAEDAVPYTEAFKAIGIEKVDHLVDSEQEDWPDIVKKLHRKRIQRQVPGSTAPIDANAAATLPSDHDSLFADRQFNRSNCSDEGLGTSLQGTKGVAAAAAAAAHRMRAGDSPLYKAV